jgi:hypothetical protein
MKTEKFYTGESKLKSIFFDLKKIIDKEFILAGQTVNSTYYCDVLQWLYKNLQRLHPNLWQQKNIIKTTHHLKHPFSPGNFWLKTT